MMGTGQFRTRRSDLAETPAQCSITVEILAYFYMNNANRLHISLSRLSATSTFSCNTCIVLYRYHCTRHNYCSQHAMTCVSSTALRTTNLAYVNWTVTVIKQCWLYHYHSWFIVTTTLFGTVSEILPHLQLCDWMWPWEVLLFRKDSWNYKPCVLSDSCVNIP